MKISSSYFPQFEKSYANKNNLRFNSALTTDIFEKRNISFAGENLFSKEEQAKLNALKLNHLRNRISELKALGLSFDEAIACLYLSNVQIDQFKNMKDRTLTIEDRIGLVAYEIENIERFKEVRTLLPEQYEALLATKIGLSDEKIEKYLSKKGTFIEYFDENGNLKKYIPTEDEWMICVKEGFTETQLSRFAQLKNRQKNLKDDTVRGQGNEQSYPIRYIVSCIEDNKSDEDIEKEDRIINLQYIFYNHPDFATKLLMMSKEDYNSFLKKLKDFKCSLDEFADTIYDQLIGLVKYAKLYDRSLPELLKTEIHSKKIPTAELEAFAVLFEKLEDKTLKDKENPEEIRKKYAQYYIFNFSKETQWRENEFYPMLRDVHGEEERRYYEVKFAEMSEEDFAHSVEIYNELYKYMTRSRALKLAMLTKKEYSRYKTLINSGYPEHVRICIAKVPKQAKRSFDQFFKAGYEAKLSSRLATMTPENLQKFIKLEQENLFSEICYIDTKTKDLRTANGSYAKYFVANLPNKTYDKIYNFLHNDDLYKELYNEIGLPRGEFVLYSTILAQLSKEQMERFKQSYLSYSNTMDAVHVSLLSKKQFEQFSELIKTGKCSKVGNACLQVLSDLSGDEEKWFSDSGLCFDYGFERRVDLTSEQILALKKIPLKLSEDQAIALAKTTKLTAVTPELLEKLPDDFWYKINTSTAKETHEIIQQAIAELLVDQRGGNSSLNLTPLKTLGCQLEKPGQGNTTVLYNKGTEYSFNKNSGDFELKTIKPFKVNLSQGLINQKPILIVKDKNSHNQYVSYNGAIAKVNPIQNHDSTQFEVWGNLLPQKQATILAKAADEFVFNLFDENGNCIIGQNAPSFDTKDKLDSEIEQYYSEKLLELKTNNKLNTQEILKLMPKNCMLTISPYIQDADFKYAVVCEWFSKDGHRWQMEIHSQDSKWNTNENWIFRLHRQTELARKYFQFTNDNEGFNFNGDTLDENAHIQITTPLEGNDLLNNVEFQTIIKQISIQQYKDFEIDKIAENLNVNGKNNEEKIQNIIDHCLKNPLDFARYKDVIWKLRASLGMVELTNV